MSTNTFACHSLIFLITCVIIGVSGQRESCWGSYCSGSGGDMKAVCKDGYCVCTGKNYDYENCLPDAYGCWIVINANTALGKPLYNNQQPTTYSCTPGQSSPRYEVHVLAMYEVINRRPPIAGDATVNIVSYRNSSRRPIILVLSSYEPVNWILNLPAGVTISKVILVAFYASESSVKGDISQVIAIERSTDRRWNTGYGRDSGGGNTPSLLRKLHEKYCVVTSFTGTYRANKWSLVVSSAQYQVRAAKCERTTTTRSTQTTRTPTASDYDDTSTPYDLSTAPILTLKAHSSENDQSKGSNDKVQVWVIGLGILVGVLVVMCIVIISTCIYKKIQRDHRSAIRANNGPAASPIGYAVRANYRPAALPIGHAVRDNDASGASPTGYAVRANDVSADYHPNYPSSVYPIVTNHGPAVLYPNIPPPSYEECMKNNDPVVSLTNHGPVPSRPDYSPAACAMFEPAALHIDEISISRDHEL